MGPNLVGSPVIILVVFMLAALYEFRQEVRGRGEFTRARTLVVWGLSMALLLVGGDSFRLAHQGEPLTRQLVLGAGQQARLLSGLPFEGAFSFTIISLFVFFAGILFCPVAPLVRMRMSRVYLLQALVLGLAYTQTVSSFLLVGAVTILGFIASVRYHASSLRDDQQGDLRAAAFTLYQSVSLLAIVTSILLRVLESFNLIHISHNLWVLDLLCLCLAAVVIVGLFPFHGWVLPFLGSPRATVFLPMFCIQTGLLFFFRLYAPIVSHFHEASILFVAIPVFGILYAALLFFGEQRLKRIPGYLYLSHVCLMAISAVGLGETGTTSSMLDGINTLVATLGLMGVCALLTSRFGVRGVLVPTGLGSFFPEIAVCYLICVLSLVGFPGTLGFIEEEVLLGQGIGQHNFLVAVIAVAFTLNGFSSFRLFARVFLGQPVLGQDTEAALLLRERTIIYLIVAAIILNGLAPSYIVDIISAISRAGD